MADFNGYKETLSKPISVILLGRAGSGRSNLLAGITDRLSLKGKNSFNINLDPLTESERLYDINICDSAPYESIKLHYNFTNTKTLLTSLNIFTTKIDQLKKILSEKESTFEYLFVDTPNPDDFLCSPSGVAVPNILASHYPTVVLYVVDCQRCQDPLVLMRTLLHACSIKMKFRLPLIVVCNKNDLVEWNVIRSWMDDSSLLMDAYLEREVDVSNDVAAKIYDFPKICEELKIITTSVKNNEGLEELVKAVDESRIEYETSYKSNHKEIERMVGIMKKQVDSLTDGPVLQELLSLPIRISYPGEHDITNDDVDGVRVEDCIERNLLLLQELRSKNENNKVADDDDDDDYENIVKEHFSLG